MEIRPEDRPDERPEMMPSRTSATVWIALTLAIILIGGGTYYLFSANQDTSTEETTAVEFQPEPLPTPPASPSTVPEVEEEIPVLAPAPTEKKVTLPSLDDSDKLAREQLALLSPDGKLELWLPGDYILRRGITLVDGLSRGIVLRKMLNAPTPEGKFLVNRDGDKIAIDPANYARYNYLVDALESLDTNSLVELFHMLRPLLEQAYGELGYPGDKVDKAFIAALDQVLATPFPLMPIYLTQESVNFKFADPALEALPPLQKQLVRMGPENTKRVQAKAKAIREALLKQ
ncbi:DUF3014 domain-containing protein [Porticoccus sp.]